MYAYIILMIIITFGGGNISDEYFKGIDDALRSISNTPYIREIVQGDLRAGTTPGWFRIGMIGLIIGLILVIALNFSADLVNSPRLKAMANIEMKEFGFSFLILIGLLALMYIMDEIFINVTRSSSNPSLNQCNSSGCVYRYIGDLIKNNYDIFKSMVIESVKIASAKYKSGSERTGFKLDYPGIPSLGFTVVSGFTPYIAEEQYYLLGLYIMSISSGIYALTMGLINIVAPLFISIGVFLRPLPFFRKLGGTMLAIGVGFFIVLPSVIVLLYSFPPSLGLSYTVNECPELCKIDIVAYSGNQRLTYDAAFRRLSAQGLSSVEISIFLDGLNTRQRNGVVSCEYINRNLINIPGITPIVLQKGRNIGIDMNTCPRICRKIPYPIDIPICYFASSACSKLYDETNGMCFLEMYDLNLLSIPVRLADGSNRILRDYIRDSNCTKLLPMRPTAEDYNIYCPLSCRGYYNRIVWGPFSEEEIQRILNSNNRDILEMIDSVNGNKISERIAEFLKDNNNFEMIISDIINGSIKQVWNADILITCGGMYNLLGSNQPCYDPNNYNHPIKAIHSAIRTNPPDDNTLRNNINQQYGSGYGDKALQIRNNNKPLQDNGLSSYKIFQDVYQGLSFQTTEQQIIQDFRNRYLRRVLDNKQTIDIPNDPNFQGWRVRFGNLWRTSCNGNDVFQVMQLVVNVNRDPSITSVGTDDIFRIASCSEIFANYINQFIQSLKNQLNMPFDAYGVCNPEEEFKIDCGYSDRSICPSETKCMNVYKTKAQQSPHQIWNSIRSTYFSGYSLDPSVARQELSKIGLPIYPKEQDCSLSISIHPDLLRFPPSPDCSKCREMSSMSNNNYLFDYIGNAVIRIVTLPLIAIFITFVTIISIS
ncbi:MAG: hypothetical protein NZ908_02190, partial [Candidatus Micrarchaeota archaeon]|nr:hypothetical protein [Candidatus Micrarchaeota archaeon]